MTLKHYSTPFLIISCAVVAVLGAGVVYCHYFFNIASNCDKQVISQEYSPLSTYLAQSVLVGCGATSADATQVILKDVKTGTQETVLSLKDDDTKSCVANWSDNTSLEITCTVSALQVYSQVKQFENVRISFSGIGPAN